MTASREFFWRRVAAERDKLNLALLPRERAVSFEAAEREYLAFQKRCLREARTERERLHIRRLGAQDILGFAHTRARTWEEYERALRRMQRLGYMNMEARLYAAALTLWASIRFPDKRPLAWALLEEAERRVLRLRRHAARKAGLESLALVKQRAARLGLTPPTPTETSRRRGTRSRLRLVAPTT